MSAFINFQGIVLYASTPGITAELYDPTLSNALYRVHFPVETPQKCMPVVTPTYFNGTGRTATVDTAGGGFVVETYSSDTGARSPNSFSIIISC